MLHLTQNSRQLILLHLPEFRGRLPEAIDQALAWQIATAFAVRFQGGLAPADNTLQLSRDILDFAENGTGGADAAWA